jgi:endo-1,4-beta-xylanase
MNTNPASAGWLRHARFLRPAKALALAQACALTAAALLLPAPAAQAQTWGTVCDASTYPNGHQIGTNTNYWLGIWESTGFRSDPDNWACTTWTSPTAWKIEWDIANYGFLHQVSRGWGNTAIDALNPNAKANFTMTLTDKGGYGGVMTGLYGWIVSGANKTTHPRVEWYIIENWFGNHPVQGDPIASHAVWRGYYDINGGRYDIFYRPRSADVYEGGVLKTEGFAQWWSVRRTKRSSGTIDYVKHIQKWKSLGNPTGVGLIKAGFFLEPYYYDSASWGVVNYSNASLTFD